MASVITVDPLLSLLRSDSPISVTRLSCSHEALHSQLHYSFDWSDFPVVGQQEQHHHQALAMQALKVQIAENKMSPSRYSPSGENPSEESTSSSSKSSSSDSSDSSSTAESSTTVSSSSAAPPSAESSSLSTASAATTQERSSPLKHEKKSVRFSPAMEVRTYSVTLGDHPCCSGGMSLTCDWQVEHTAVVDLDVHERFSFKRRQGELKLSYVQRRQRLVECTGLSPCQLLNLQQLQRCQNDYNNASNNMILWNDRVMAAARTTSTLRTSRSVQQNLCTCW